LPSTQTALTLKEHGSPSRAKGMLSLVITILLCLPSLIGGSVLFFNLATHRNITEWEQTSSALVALGLLFGGPLVALAMILGGITALSSKVPPAIKYAELSVVSTATIATLSLLSRFGKF